MAVYKNVFLTFTTYIRKYVIQLLRQFNTVFKMNTGTYTNATYCHL